VFSQQKTQARGALCARRGATAMEIAFLLSTVLLLIVSVMHSTTVESIQVFDSLQRALDSGDGDHHPEHDHHKRRHRSLTTDFP
jgi:hypothetical protein